MRSDVTIRVQRAISDIRQGKMVVLVDDEDRENEGDLCMAADKIDAAAINFMAKHGRGLICLTLTEDRVRDLQLPMMVDENRAVRTTAFTVSIEARTGVTTGISAADRAHTIRTAVNPTAHPSDIVSPGHIFPIKARPGGVLQRTGHTEGSVDLARMAGCAPAGVICEIMNEDGTMARRPDLEKFALTHDLVLLSIADLIEYRLQNERLVHRVREGQVAMPSGAVWNALVYRTDVEQREFLALTLGEAGHGPTLVRVHTGSVLSDVFGVHREFRADIRTVLSKMEAEGKGIVLFLPPSRVDLDRDLAFHLGQPMPQESESGPVLREYGLGAQVLADLGVHQLRLLMNRPRRLAALEAYGLEVIEQIVLSDLDADADVADAPPTTH